MTVPQRCSIVNVGADDLPRLRAFYSARLGWTEVPDSSDDWVGYLAGGVLFALWRREALAAESASSDGVRPAKGAIFNLATGVDSAAEVDTVCSRWAAAGAVVVAEPFDQPWGGRSAYLTDPEGNVWEIAWAPGASFGERGEVVSYGGSDRPLVEGG